MNKIIDSFSSYPDNCYAWVLQTALQNKASTTPLVIITNTQQEAQVLQQELQYYGWSATIFPDWETLPYDQFSPNQDVISTRLTVLTQLINQQIPILLVQVSTLMHKLTPTKHLMQHSFCFKVQQKLNLSTLKQNLSNFGYVNVNLVLEHGQFAVRGAIIDIFPMGHELPIRIELDDDVICDLKYFNQETQLSTTTVDNIKILPAKEYAFDETAISNFRANWRKHLDGAAHNCIVYQEVTSHIMSPGLEYYLHLFFNDTSTLFDYVHPSSKFICLKDITKNATSFNNYYMQRYEQYRHDLSRPLLAPHFLFLSALELQEKMSNVTVINFATQNTNTNYQAIENFNLQLNNETNVKQFIHRLQQIPHHKIIFSFESAGRKALMQEMLSQFKINYHPANHLLSALQNEVKINCILAPLERGFQNADFMLITEHESFGFKIISHKQAKNKNSSNFDNIIKNLADLQLGAPLVHLQYGVGIYCGLTKMDIYGVAAEYVTLEYKDQDKIYVPVSNLHLISRYSANNPDSFAINSLRSSKWQQQKSKIAWQIKDTAAELLKTYAKRDTAVRAPYKIDFESYHSFAADFPYQETDDQLSTIYTVLQDLSATKPMDRVICGDVGFGKTEIAMRAAFIAVMNQKQVAVLAPTTLLADQHAQTFLDRFANFPVNIAVISRFKTKSQIKEILAKVANGNIDIIIGTHRLLQNDVSFKNLGLIIIDEEHRFGVDQKEKFKNLRAKIDILNLTATPIPRTLNLALSKMRDLSIIATPPKSRLSIKTFVRPRNKTLIQEAITRELNRSGQVFFVHNKIETMPLIAAEITALNPEAKIIIAHGQMNERELEQIMLDFCSRKFNVLICTTIIENGIDIPTVNTIIIDRADSFGLAQLHQLRGRVGRSHHQAYAFLLHPEMNAITKDAVLRLDAISRYDSLGAGFALATNDMEIRGAGEILGDEQSGNINTIGFTLFMELLQKAVSALEAGVDFDIDLGEVDLQIQVPALIPEDYIKDIQLRLNLYKKIANTNTFNEVDKIKIEIIDRFGDFPEEIALLLQCAKIRILAKELSITKITFTKHGGQIDFATNPNIDQMTIIKLIQSNPHEYMFANHSSIKIKKHFEKPQLLVAFILDFLTKITIKHAQEQQGNNAKEAY